ncbi:MAG: type II toxin-antitoxin system ParD family antitoxin [Acidobacteria bacterium]|nr:type II toxin-antitoxin system ParD family antitoxin [Acidobacteriota bacterium]
MTPRLERLINKKLRSGQYQTPAEVIEEALNALDERDQALRARLEHADSQLRNGEYVEYDEHTIRDLARQVKVRGKVRLAQERKLRSP